MADSLQGHSFGAYYRLLVQRRAFRILWLGEIVNDLGTWLNFVATIRVVETFAPGQTSLVSLALVVKTLPSAVLFPVTGLVADRCDKAGVLAGVNLVAAAFVGACALVGAPPWLWLLFVLAFGQASTASFYDPAKRALTPSLVTPEELPLATALDVVAWSAIGAFGSALGGFAVSHLGTAACFLLDAGTYLVAAWQARQLMRALPLGARYGDGGKAGEEGGISLVADASASGVALAESEAARRRSEARESASGEAEDQPLLPAFPSPRLKSASPAAQLEGGEEAAPSRGFWREAYRELQGIVEGWRYMWTPGNRDIAVFVLLKGSGGLLWGCSDILNVRFSDMPRMQALGDAPTTLGLLFSAVAVGCFVGPLAYNRLTPNKLGAFLRASASTFWLLLLGYALMGLAGSIYTLLPSVVVRSCGSAVLWTYSSLILQVRADARYLGRVLALEMAVYTLLMSGSVFFGGFATESLGLSERGLIAVMGCVTLGVATAWTLYARAYQDRAPQALKAKPSGAAGRGEAPLRGEAAPVAGLGVSAGPLSEGLPRLGHEASRPRLGQEAV